MVVLNPAWAGVSSDVQFLAGGKSVLDRHQWTGRFCLPGSPADYRRQKALFPESLGYAVSRISDSRHRAGGDLDKGARARRLLPLRRRVRGRPGRLSALVVAWPLTGDQP